MFDQLRLKSCQFGEKSLPPRTGLPALICSAFEFDENRFAMDLLRILMDFLRFPMDLLRFPMDLLGSGGRVGGKPRPQYILKQGSAELKYSGIHNCAPCAKANANKCIFMT